MRLFIIRHERKSKKTETLRIYEDASELYRILQPESPPEKSMEVELFQVHADSEEDFLTGEKALRFKRCLLCSNEKNFETQYRFMNLKLPLVMEFVTRLHLTGRDLGYYPR